MTSAWDVAALSSSSSSSCFSYAVAKSCCCATNCPNYDDWSQWKTIHCSNSKDTSVLRVSSSLKQQENPSFVFRVGLISGAFAGAIVDVVLFPLDTLKTRLQSSQGTRWSTQLFRGIYRGLGPAVVASAPAGAAFFGTYDFIKRITSPMLSESQQVFGHIIAAIAGDVAGSTVRVPFEVVKQNLQAGVFSSSRQAVVDIVRRQGFLAGLYRGWLSLILREIPFDIIEFPLYEYLKKRWSANSNNKEGLETWKTATCGCIAGAVAAALTTPLDVAKTRVMVVQGDAKNSSGIASTLIKIAKEEGVACLFSGMIPRVLWIGLGGAIFFASFESCKRWLTQPPQQLEEEQTFSS